MGRKKRGGLSRADLVKEAATLKEASTVKEDSAVKEVSTVKVAIDVIEASTVKASAVREAATVEGDEAPVTSPVRADIKQPQGNLHADLDLVEQLRKLAISKQAESPSAVPENILNLVVLQEILMNIPHNAHPSVKEFLKSKALEFLEVKHVNTQELMKYLPSLSRDEIKNRMEVASSAAETSFALVLTPPVSCCIKVRTTK